MNKSKELIDSIFTRLNYLDDITSRSMFGGYGICQNQLIFGLISEGALYLRANEKLEQIFIDDKMKQLNYLNRGIPILMRYYLVDSVLWNDGDKFKMFVDLALQAAEEDKIGREKTKGYRLKELPNITLSLERLLWRVGILNPKMLFELGAVQAYLKIKQISQNVSTNILFALAAAIEGYHVARLTEHFKERLLNSLN